MTDIKTLGPDEAVEAVAAMETIEELRAAATEVGLKFSGNTGVDTLQKNLIEFIKTPKQEKQKAPVQEAPKAPVPDAASFLGSAAEEEEIEVSRPIKKPKGPTIAEMLLMDETQVEDVNLRRLVIRAKALQLNRVRITNLDPADVQLSGGIVTCYNKYTGKVSKYIPYGEESENGYHVPKILLDHLRGQRFALRKEIKGGQFGVKKYNTVMVNKFAIEELPALTKKELADLAANQRASHAIDN